MTDILLTTLTFVVSEKRCEHTDCPSGRSPMQRHTGSTVLFTSRSRVCVWLNIARQGWTSDDHGHPRCDWRPIHVPARLEGLIHNQPERSLIVLAAIFFTGNHFTCLAREDVDNEDDDAWFRMYNDGNTPKRVKFQDELARPCKQKQVCNVLYITCR